MGQNLSHTTCCSGNGNGKDEEEQSGIVTTEGSTIATEDKTLKPIIQHSQCKASKSSSKKKMLYKVEYNEEDDEREHKDRDGEIESYICKVDDEENDDKESYIHRLDAD